MLMLMFYVFVLLFHSTFVTCHCSLNIHTWPLFTQLSSRDYCSLIVCNINITGRNCVGLDTGEFSLSFNASLCNQRCLSPGGGLHLHPQKN